MALFQDPKDDGYVPVTLQAHDLVFGDRQASYGHPLDDFSCTAAMWTAYLKHRGLLKEGAEVVAEDFGPMMILAKVSRQANAPKLDNMVDSAGYAETTERVIFERARRNKATSECLEDGLEQAAEQIEAQKARIDPLWGANKPPYTPAGCRNHVGVKLEVLTTAKPEQVREALSREMVKQVIRQGDNL